eukprot:CAMPEP_0180820396 /NCGR_PEP_ID=MMETSP1038_2-20121128/70256_1 /TAXON_ID=632150 /ORGANISM="Azadinium spinosum, Strain 3D9" /LENGTH=41 /DNA_ID= /DNA_START= /DNA_END= /DNA_ORIENTATION=
MPTWSRIAALFLSRLTGTDLLACSHKEDMAEPKALAVASLV